VLLGLALALVLLEMRLLVFAAITELRSAAYLVNPPPMPPREAGSAWEEEEERGAALRAAAS
jgi:hypothetical protein